MTFPREDPPAVPDRTRSHRTQWVVAAALVLAAATGLAATALLRSGGDTPAMAGMVVVSPGGVVEREAVPTALLPRYVGAESYPEVFSATPCFCGCATMLGHRHLLDCFIRADGAGWEAHALGCAVCLGEADQVLQLLADGRPVAEIVAAVVEQWSDPYLTGS